jgi:hypothetical protein
MASKDKTVDVKAFVAAIGKGYKLTPTPKTRAGMKPGQQQLVKDKAARTLAMLTKREAGVRVEGSRLERNVTVTDSKGVEEARKLIASVEQENVRRDKEREAKATKQPTRSEGKADAATTKAPVETAKGAAPSGRRARARSATRAETVA